MKKSMKIFLIVFLFLCTGVAFSQNIKRCDVNQKYCYIYNKRLVTGDMVSIVNESGLLVAIGQISAMQDIVRRITITKRYGPINNTCKVAQISEEVLKNPSEHFQMIKPIPKNYINGAVNLGSLWVGNTTMAYGLEGGYDWYWQSGFTYGAKGVLYFASGDATNHLTSGLVGYSTFALLAEGVFSYRSPESYPVSVKIDLDAGFGFVSLTSDKVVEGVTAFDDYSGGATLTYGASLYGILNTLGNLRPMFGGNISWVQSRRYMRLSLGASYPLF